MTEATPPGPEDQHPGIEPAGRPPDPPASPASVEAADALLGSDAAAAGSDPDGAGEVAGAAPPVEQLQSIIEALLFVADGPVPPVSLAKAIGIPPRALEGPLEALAEALRMRGLRLQRGPEGIQLVTAPFASSYVEQFLGLESAKRLSTAALEALAIVAYRQPVTRGQVEAIRGVNSDAAIDTLRTRGLIDIIGRADSPGRPAIFGTTQRFLEHFGLERPEDLPPLPEEVAGVASARFRDHGAQLPLPPVEEAAHTHPPTHPPGDPPPHPDQAAEPAEPREPAARPLPPAELERRPATEGRPRLPASGVSLPRTLPGAPPRPSDGGPPRSGPSGGSAPRFG